MSVLAILIPLAESFAFKVATLLRLESLIDLAHFKLRSPWLLLTRHHGLLGHLLGLLLHLLLLLLHELLLCLAGHGHLCRLGCLHLLYSYLLWVSWRRGHLLLARGVDADRHGHLLGSHSIGRHRGFKLLLLSLLVLNNLLLLLVLLLL